MLKVCFKTKVQAKGIEISQFTIIKTIGLPLVVVAVDVATDSNLLFDMNSYIDTLRANSTSNSTDDNVARAHEAARAPVLPASAAALSLAETREFSNMLQNRQISAGHI